MDARRLVRAVGRGVAAAVLGGLVGAVLTRVALAGSRDRWPLVLFGIGALAIPVQAVGMATTDLAAVGPLSTGQWALLAGLFVALAAVYVLQATIVFHVARSGRRTGERMPADPLAGAALG
jgi:hypothetical protein